MICHIFNNTHVIELGSVEEPTSVRLFSDASVDDINLIQDDFDLSLNS